MKRLALILCLISSVAIAQSYEYAQAIEQYNPMRPSKTVVSYSVGDKFVTTDSTETKFTGLVPMLNYLGAQGWEVISTQAKGTQYYYLLKREKPLLNE